MSDDAADLGFALALAGATLLAIALSLAGYAALVTKGWL